MSEENEFGTEFRVEIEGIKPLLMHSTRGMTSGPKLKRGAILPPEDEAELALYKNEEGIIVIPGDILLGSIKSASTDFKVGGKGRKTFKTYVDSGLEIEDAVLDPQEYAIDSRPVKIGQARIIRSRPRFDKWNAVFYVTIIDGETWLDPFDKEFGGGATLRDIIMASGQFKGICDFRPRFGRFRVISFEPVEE